MGFNGNLLVTIGFEWEFYGISMGLSWDLNGKLLGNSSVSMDN